MEDDAEALKNRDEFVCIISDIQMPLMGRGELIKELRKFDEITPSVFLRHAGTDR